MCIDLFKLILTFKPKVKEKTDEWVSLKPPTNIQPPDLKKIAPNLLKTHEEQMRHTYRDKNGDLLFFISRLVDKEEPSNKTFLHISYGYWKGSDKNYQKWALKAYQAEEKTLYNLHLLRENPLASILIVEGEKTADTAGKIFSKENKLFSKEEFICVTWPGGASAVSKTDWTPLYGRKVIIWPDNDDAGYKAADAVCSELRKVGAKSIAIVEKDVLLKELPKKWDLADPLPEGKTSQFIKDRVLNAKEKSVDVNQLVLMVDSKKTDVLDKLKAQEVLWKVEERLWPVLEEKYGGKTWEIKKEILSESVKIMLEQKNVEKMLIGEHGAKGDIATKLSYQVLLHKAEKGIMPLGTNIQAMKETLSDFGKLLDVNALTIQNKEVSQHAIGKLLSDAFSKGLQGKDMQKEMPSAVNDLSKSVEIEKVMLISRDQSRHRDIGLER